jgi:DNA-cytosine methyltransferase
MIKVFESFAGYGGGSFALKKINMDFECVGYSEIDKNAIKCYEQNHKGVKNFGDITKINPLDIPDFDLFLGGFPCQDVSIAGKRDLSKGRTNLYKEILRIVKVKQPKYVLLENVAGLLSMGRERTLINIVVADLKKIGYRVCWKKLNSKDFGIPQSRDRVWIACFREDIYEPFRFQFPIKEPLKIVVKDILELDIDKKYFLTGKQLDRIKFNKRHSNEMLITKNISPTLLARDYKDGGKRIKLVSDNNIYSNNQVYSINGLIPTLTVKESKDIKVYSLMPRSSTTKKGGSGCLSKVDDSSYCVDTANNQAIEIFDDYNSKFKEEGLVGTITQNIGSKSERNGQKVIDNINSIIRRLTPKECFRLMGFLNDEINLDGLSDTAKYKLAGNGWEINLASKVLKNMLQQEVS